MHVVATAGHVDHGKSTLVLALTGTDPDRWQEEKDRGLTIDLGFASMTLPSGHELSFVDVPGHVRFLKNMLAGVGAVESCVFVVAATEGWKPQSEEHLRILDLLGVSTGVVALTKVALVDDDDRELAALDVAAHVEGTFLEGAPIIAVDAPTGAGLDDLGAALDAMTSAAPAAFDAARPRLWVDRSFAARGSGTVVTGTLAGGSVSVDDEVVVLPHRRVARVRALQTHGRAMTHATPGRRLAVNLAGISHDQVVRGDAVVRDGDWWTTSRADATLAVLPTLDHDVRRRGAYKAYIGSGEHAVAVRVIGTEAIAPGSSGLVRLHLSAPLPLVPGDRYVLRDTGRGETVGGGEILDVDPVLPVSRARPDRSAARVVRERGWVEAGTLRLLTGSPTAANVGRWVVDPDELARTVDRLRDRVEASGPAGFDVALLDERERAVLPTLEGVEVGGGRARTAGTDDPLRDHPFVAALAASPFRPPGPDECAVDRQELRTLVHRGQVVERDGIWFAPSAVEEAARVVARLLEVHPEGVTASQVREALGTTRKYLLPLLGHLDATGVTRRRGDVRIAGPRLPPVS